MTEALEEADYCLLPAPISGDGANSSIAQRGKTKRFKVIKQAIQRVKSFEDENNNDDSNQLQQNSNTKACGKAVRFKYTANAARADIEQVRKLLTFQRQHHNLSQEEWQFLESDYERLMVDDWLVTRFLLRGKKASFMNVNLGNSRKVQAHRKDLDPVIARTMNLLELCGKFRWEYRVNAQTVEAEFPIEWTSVNGVFKHRFDRAGNPVAYMRCALHKPKLIESPDVRYLFKRFLLYVVEQCDKDLFQRPGIGVCCVYDLTGMSLDNTDLELTQWMIKSTKACAPKLHCYVILYNPPWFFTATFKLICNTLLSNNKRQSIKFVHGDEILDYIDYINLPSYLRSALI